MDAGCAQRTGKYWIGSEGSALAARDGRTHFLRRHNGNGGLGVDADVVLVAQLFLVALDRAAECLDVSEVRLACCLILGDGLTPHLISPDRGGAGIAYLHCGLSVPGATRGEILNLLALRCRRSLARCLNGVYEVRLEDISILDPKCVRRCGRLAVPLFVGRD